MMKISVLYASAGAGHTKAAQAVYNYLKNKPGLQIKLEDVMVKAGPLLKFSYLYGYSSLVNYFPLGWSIGFHLTSFKFFRLLTRPLSEIINRLGVKALVSSLIEENPDLIITTHFLPAEIAGYLKARGKINSKIFSIITDFAVHPFWISRGIDKYLVASDYTKNKLLAKNIDEQKIKVIGIPVEEKFLTKIDRTTICNKLGLDCSKFTVLIVTGSFGLGPIEKIVDSIKDQVQILVVCAKNQALLKKLNTLNLANLRAFGFVDNVEELMGIADLIITKPGGLSISEVLIKELFPVFISPIPGQESENINAMLSYGIGIYPKSIKEIKEMVVNLKNHPSMMDSIRKQIRKVRKPLCLEELDNEICASGLRTGS